MASKKQDNDDMVDEEEEEQSTDLDNPEVVEKYKLAATAANTAMAAVLKEILPGKKVFDICVIGDKALKEATTAIPLKTKDKGAAFPCSISVNNTAVHYSPLRDDEKQVILKEGDLVKIDLGAHVDGFVSACAHTTIATANPQQATTGRKADAIAAAHYASEIALRLIKPGKKNSDVTEAINQVISQFKCSPLEGVLSHQMKKFVIDGNQVIINKTSVDQKVEEFEFADNTVYCIDIVVSTGEGKAKEGETRCNIYKRSVEQTYQLKMQTSRAVFKEINKKFPTFPFCLRNLEDEKKGKLGISEMSKHGLVLPYPVLYEKPGEFIAQFKYTCLILPSGTYRLNQFPLPFVTSEHKIESAELNTLLSQPTTRQ